MIIIDKTKSVRSFLSEGRMGGMAVEDFTLTFACSGNLRLCYIEYHDLVKIIIKLTLIPGSIRSEYEESFNKNTTSEIHNIFIYYDTILSMLK